MLNSVTLFITNGSITVVIKDLTERIGETFGHHINRNLTDLMQRNNISLTLLHRNTGVAIPTIKRLQEDPTTNPTLSTLIPIANFFNVSLNQLIGSEIDLFFLNKSHYFKIPYIEWKQAVIWPTITASDEQKFTLVDIDAGNNPYALIVEENDWLGMPKGSILIINADIKNPNNKDYVVTCKKNHYPSLHQVLFDQDKFYLKSLNPQLPLILADESYQFFGKLIQIRQNPEQK